MPRVVLKDSSESVLAPTAEEPITSEPVTPELEPLTPQSVTPEPVTPEKPPVSARKMRANRLNAQRRTRPKTSHTKTKSRGNARKRAILACEIGFTSPDGRGDNRGRDRTQGLDLDDFLATIGWLRRDFRLPVPQFGLKEMEQYPRSREALETLIRSIINRHGTEICAKPDPLLSEINRDVYLEQFVSEVYSGWRISPKWIHQSLEKLLEISLQTIARLPTSARRSSTNWRRIFVRSARKQMLCFRRIGP
jgi:hypothetical protein